MSANNKTIGARAALIGAAALGLMAAAPAQAAKLGPYFPLPMGFSFTPTPKEGLLSTQSSWLHRGLDNLKKAKAEAEKAKADGKDVAAADAKIAEVDALIADTEKEIAIADDNTASQDIQAERKRLFLLNLNQWINGLEHEATQQMKAAILGDGAAAMVAQNQAAQLSEQSERLENAKRNDSINQWGLKR
jgi:hypothetical protein